MACSRYTTVVTKSPNLFGGGWSSVVSNLCVSKTIYVRFSCATSAPEQEMHHPFSGNADGVLPLRHEQNFPHDEGRQEGHSQHTVQDGPYFFRAR